MSDHNIPGYTLDSLIGEGSCGLVYRATYQGQYPRCVKVFKAMAVNRQLLGQSLARMFREPPHEGIVDLYQFDLNHRPAYVATGFLGDNAPTLEDYVGRMEEDDAWLVLGKIADAAGYLHKFGVPHCGLKPSNILIDGSPDKPKLTDFTQGLLAGLHHMEIGDQPYYAAPEQIENPDGILDRRAQLWDVYAFGVVAYRLITGRFPRGDDFVRQIEQRAAAGAMLSLEPRDFAAVARSQPGIRWPSEAPDEWCARKRAVAEQCLSLEPMERPADLRDVAAAFAKIEADRELASVWDKVRAEEQAKHDEVARGEANVEKERKKVASKLWLARAAALVLLLALGGAAGWGYLTLQRAEKAEKAIGDNQADYEKVIGEKDAKIAAEIADAQKARADRDAAYASLGESQSIADGLFDQIATARLPGDPGYRERSEILGDSLAYYRAQSAALAEGGTDFEKARAAYSIAQLELALGAPASEVAEAFGEARSKLDAFLKANPEHPDAALYRGRLADCSEQLAAANLRAGKPAEAAEDARRAIADLGPPAADDDKRRLAYLQYQLGLAERECRNHEDAAAALAKAEAAFAALTGAESPGIGDTFYLALSRQGQGFTAADQGDADAAMKFHLAAIEDFLKLPKEHPRREEFQFRLALSYGALGDLIGVTQDLGEAVKAHNLAQSILEDLVRSGSDNTDYYYHLARRYGQVSDFERDKGRSADALERSRRADAFLEAIVKRAPKNARYRHALAQEKGRLCQLLMDDGKDAEAVQTCEYGAKLMDSLLGEAAAANDEQRAHDYAVTAGRLYGMLGHLREAAADKPGAVTAFEKSIAHWQSAASADPDNADVAEDLARSQERLKRLQ